MANVSNFHYKCKYFKRKKIISGKLLQAVIKSVFFEKLFNFNELAVC